MPAAVAYPGRLDSPLLGLCLLPVLAAAQTLGIGTQYAPNTLAPHFFASFPPGTSHNYIYDRLGPAGPVFFFSENCPIGQLNLHHGTVKKNP